MTEVKFAIESNSIAFFFFSLNNYRKPYSPAIVSEENTIWFLNPKEQKNMDELGIEPKTSPMLRERATNYATRPLYFYNIWIITDY